MSVTIQTMNARGEIDGLPVHVSVFSSEIEMITIASAPVAKPDPKWTFVDANDHFHATSLDPKEPFPTLNRREEYPEGWEDDPAWEEPVGQVVYRCRACAAEVSPGFVHDWEGEREVPASRSWSAVVSRPEGFTPALDSFVSIRIRQDERETFGIGTVRQLRRDSIVILGFGPYGAREVTS